jgi:hypothetical protein
MANDNSAGFGAGLLESARRGVLLGMFGVAALASAGGCASSHVLTQGEIGRKGARSFAAPPSTVFYACVGVLMADGYEIATSDPEQGVIVTKPLGVDGEGPVTARSYRITIAPGVHGGSRVVAAPYIYSGTRDVSEGELWNLDGPHGELALWNELFEDVDAVVVRPAPDASEREALAKAAAPSSDSPGGGKTAAPEPGLRPATLGPAPRAPARRPASGE